MLTLIRKFKKGKVPYVIFEFDNKYYLDEESIYNQYKDSIYIIMTYPEWLLNEPITLNGIKLNCYLEWLREDIYGGQELVTEGTALMEIGNKTQVIDFIFEYNIQ